MGLVGFAEMVDGVQLLVHLMKEIGVLYLRKGVDVEDRVVEQQIF